MKRRATQVVLFISMLLAWPVFAYSADATTNMPRVFTVAADPNNLPFSNAREQGFENKLAKLVAGELKATLKYIWQPQRRGFLKDTLGSGRCDAVMGVPAGVGQCLLTAPYYRSTYVFVMHRPRDKLVSSLDDESLRGMKIGVQLMGDGQMAPPGYALVERGLGNKLVGFSMYSDGRAENPPSEIIQAVADGKIDLALAWGPMAGYFAKRKSNELVAKPIPQPANTPIPYSFDMCIAVGKSQPQLRDEIDSILKSHRSEIAALLREYSVPRVDEVDRSSPKSSTP